MLATGKQALQGIPIELAPLVNLTNVAFPFQGVLQSESLTDFEVTGEFVRGLWLRELSDYNAKVAAH
jgi:hypothetical protein